MEFSSVISQIETCLNQHLRLSTEKVNYHSVMENWSEMVHQLKNLQNLISEHTLSQELSSQIESLIEEDHALEGQIESSMKELTSIYDTTLPQNNNLKIRRKVDANTLLEYGRRLSKFSSAPPGYNPETGQDAKAPVHYPWPSEDQMRKTSLFQYSTNLIAHPSANASQILNELEETSAPSKEDTDATTSPSKKAKHAVDYTMSPTFTNATEQAETQGGESMPSSKDIFADFDLFDPEMEEDS
ncbi:mediator complex subunit Pmc4 [Schizosaccharomyces cryophilus OY26]|uniref:Mediator of RNA polymerase II transcription subunit 4 n=1 Tax=Schizosaccharomyces cryophilus (strain OY26 / ATCC MYA-4695 / CBS 11777 / NBRC 106824 / NRRL Y48691) TaxID=653667 RepID=S9X983_SCHCR|nr:mediator complex subunit Pmc4 [Schizosaccharomyces cryophilus OY26]EPY53762.1 mediator complex subunit Pmc4 [Schizosaccharomyces cryophilus OY26]